MEGLEAAEIGGEAARRRTPSPAARNVRQRTLEDALAATAIPVGVVEIEEAEEDNPEAGTNATTLSAP
eukprot:8357404-Alexandrium_andersonii.AAC.1